MVLFIDIPDRYFMGYSLVTVEQVKDAHQTIKEAVADVQAHVRNFAQSRPYLREMESALIAHLGREDVRLYEELRKRSADRAAAKMIEFLEFDLKELKIALLFFFDRYLGTPVSVLARKFPLEFAEFSAKVLGRIRIEEEYLLPLLDHRQKKDA